MTELSYALASGQQYAGLTPVERAAAETDLHLSTCDEPILEDCQVCQVKLARIRRLIEAVQPVIEAEARIAAGVAWREPLRAVLRRVLAGYQPDSRIEGLPAWMARVIDQEANYAGSRS